MANRINYAKEMDKAIAGLGGQKPRLLLHACCGPCSSGVLSQIEDFFEITILYYNPNIDPPEEYHRREAELEMYLAASGRGIPVIELPYDPREFYQAVKGLEQEPERGERCTVCYRQRMEAAARYAADHGFDWFTTTLSVSPLKDPVRINQIGAQLEAQYGVKHLPSEFRKRDGYKHSLEESAKYGLYRQDYCGCVFSRRERFGKE